MTTKTQDRICQIICFVILVLLILDMLYWGTIAGSHP